MNNGTQRWILPFTEWSESHRKAWQSANQEGDVFSDHGLASRWTTKTQKQITKDYGMWLRHQNRRQPNTVLNQQPQELTKATLRPFVTELQDRLAPISVCSRLRGLSEAYRVMWPNVDRAVLRRLLSRLNSSAHPSRNKQALVISSREILKDALSHFETVVSGPAPSETIRASWVRNALMIAMLAAHPIRLANLTMIRLGVHLDQLEDQLWLRFGSHETKEKRAFDTPLAKVLHAPLAKYLEEYRPILLDNHESDALWISVRKGPMKESSVYDQIVRITETVFGHPINPHLFRDCAMTTLASEDPSHVRVAARLLGHTSLSTGELYYNQATMLSAVARYHQTIADLRGSEPPLEELSS